MARELRSQLLPEQLQKKVRLPAITADRKNTEFELLSTFIGFERLTNGGKYDNYYHEGFLNVRHRRLHQLHHC